MEPLNRIKDTIGKFVGTGRSKVDGMQRQRQRGKLFRELGEAQYANSKGVATSAAEIDRLIGEIDALDQPAETNPAEAS